MRTQTKEKWIRWELEPGLSNNYYCESLSDNSGKGLRICLYDEKDNKILVSFPNSVDAYRTEEETNV